ncbi:hypothetical protein FISHEDRAFT_72277 [Fistulina hepatica ATCC 64428]|uniref:Uncharacterized protein n=1 Tax=Fistulina hepatica ATCC 64428 TaxID=1128425 RepID=A0A0D7AH37_9AGAR|nr:hypothetical protein FISHEDRAFT_72277 [Fistulina hepatica ATCC 64428]
MLKYVGIFPILRRVVTLCRHQAASNGTGAGGTRNVIQTDVLTPTRRPPRKRYTEDPFKGKDWIDAWKDLEPQLQPPIFNSDNLHHRLIDVFNAFQRRPFPRQFPVVRDIWDQFRLFTGMQFEMPIWKRAGEDSDDNADDFEEPHNPPKKKYVRRPYAQPTIVDSDDDITRLFNAENQRMEKQKMAFLDDPAMQPISVLLSHEPNLTNIPRLIAYFLRYCLRYNAFPGLNARDEDMDVKIKDAIAVSELALQELPLTARLSKAILPNALGEACRSLWGKSGLVMSSSNVHEFAVGIPANDIDEFADEVAEAFSNERALEELVDGAEPDDDVWEVELEHPIPADIRDALGATYMPGAVETSMRRIKAVSGALASTTECASVQCDLTPENVEYALKQHAVRIVLEPWLGWASQDQQVAEPVVHGFHGDTALAVTHDPWMTNITVFMDPSTLPFLKTGMGVGATFVQVVPRVRGDSTADIWYVERVDSVIPSYYKDHE